MERTEPASELGTAYQQIADRVLRSQPVQLRNWHERREAERLQPPPEPKRGVTEVVGGRYGDISYRTDAGDQAYPKLRGKRSRKPLPWCAVCQRRWKAAERKPGHVHDPVGKDGKLIRPAPRARKPSGPNTTAGRPRRQPWKVQGLSGGVSMNEDDPRPGSRR